MRRAAHLSGFLQDRLRLPTNDLASIHRWPDQVTVGASTKKAS